MELFIENEIDKYSALFFSNISQIAWPCVARPIVTCTKRYTLILVVHNLSFSAAGAIVKVTACLNVGGARQVSQVTRLDGVSRLTK